MNLSALFANAGDNDGPAVPQPDALALTLRERFAALLQVHSFKPGDLVIPKRGLDPRHSRFADLPMIVVEDDLAGYPAPEPAAMGDAVSRCDIVLLSEDVLPGTAVLRLYDSRTLEPWPRQEPA